MTAVRIDVTAGDIAKGAPQDCNSCPVQFATARAMPWLRLVRVYEEVIVAWPNGSGTGASIQLPESAVAFISRFDSDDPAAPFSFEIDVPDKLTVPQ